jgi:transposase
MLLLSRHDLLQMDDAYLESLSEAELLSVSQRLLNDLKEVHERLNQNPRNSSLPPSSQAPYLGIAVEDEPETDEEERTEESSFSKRKDSDSSEENDLAESEFTKEGDQQEGQNSSDIKEQESGNVSSKRKRGKQLGAPGFGRRQVIPPGHTDVHRAESCAACGASLTDDAPFVARMGFDVWDIELGSQERPGVSVTCTRHIYGETTCCCGHRSLRMPGHGERYEVEGRKQATCLSEWRLIGPMLSSLIVCLAFRMRLSRPRIREFLKDWLHLELSVGVINQCIHEAGLASAPVHEELIEEVRNSGLLHVDETSWKEHGTALWLWVFVTSNIVLFTVGRRTRQVVLEILTEEYAGWLMSDGFINYRIFRKRLRCLAHLLRKGRGLSESLNREVRQFGRMALDVLEFVINQVRDGPNPVVYRAILEDFRRFCESHKDFSHKKTRALAREFLNDWDAIWAVLENPHLPITNNEAERALRHWVIARLLSHGTRTVEGSRVFAILATVIETCRKRGFSPWPYLAAVITERRKGNAAPPLPATV